MGGGRVDLRLRALAQKLRGNKNYFDVIFKIFFSDFRSSMPFGIRPFNNDPFFGLWDFQSYFFGTLFLAPPGPVLGNNYYYLLLFIIFKSFLKFIKKFITFNSRRTFHHWTRWMPLTTCLQTWTKISMDYQFYAQPIYPTTWSDFYPPI